MRANEHDLNSLRGMIRRLQEENASLKKLLDENNILYFWGRTDVYARRGKVGGYFPRCSAWWDNPACPKKADRKKFCKSIPGLQVLGEILILAGFFRFWRKNLTS